MKGHLHVETGTAADFRADVNATTPGVLYVDPTQGLAWMGDGQNQVDAGGNTAIGEPLQPGSSLPTASADNHGKFALKVNAGAVETLHVCVKHQGTGAYSWRAVTTS